LIPTLKGEHFVFLVEVKHIQKLTAQAAGLVVPVPAAPNEVAIEASDTMKIFVKIPIKRHIVLKPIPLKEFLPLEDHGDAWGSKHQSGCQGGTLLRKPAGWVGRVDFLRDARFAVGNFVVTFTV